MKALVLIGEVIGILITTVFALKVSPVMVQSYSDAQMNNISFDGGTTTTDYSWVAGLGYLIFAIAIALLPLALLGVVIYQVAKGK